MFCEKCGNKIQDNAQFCEFCGAQISRGSGPLPQQSNQQGTGQLNQQGNGQVYPSYNVPNPNASGNNFRM